MRKIVQIAQSDTGAAVVITALCDDGSLWAINTKNLAWNRLPDIPQDQPLAKEAE